MLFLWSHNSPWLIVPLVRDLPTKRHVSRNGPKWFTCMPICRLSAVCLFPRPVAPALLISISTLGSVLMMFSANLRIDAKDVRSRWCTSTLLFAVCVTISSVIKKSVHVEDLYVCTSFLCLSRCSDIPEPACYPKQCSCPSQYWVISSILPTLPGHILTLITFTLKMEETCSSKTVSTHLQEYLVLEPRKSNLKFCLFLLQTWLRNLIVCLKILIVFLASRNKLSIWEQ